MNDRRRRYVTWILAFVLGVSILTVGYLASNPSLTTTGHTEFYVVSEENTTSPTTVASGGVAEFRLGIANHEHRAVAYRVRALINGTERSTQTVRVPDSESQELPVSVTAPSELGRYRVQFRLLYGDNETAALTTWSWIRVGE